MAKKSPKSTSTPSFVSENELKSVLNMRARIEKYKEALKEEQATLAAAEEDLISRLNLGQEVVGSIEAQVLIEKGRSSPKWKDEWSELVSRMGLDVTVEEAKVKSQYPATSKEVLDINPPKEA